MLVCAVTATVLLFTFAARVVLVSGPSMRETLQHRDCLLVMNAHLCGGFEAGDIVIIRKESFKDGEPIVKRVIATEGQTVDIDFTAGAVYVDGQLLEEDYIRQPTYLAVSYTHLIDAGGADPGRSGCQRIFPGAAPRCPGSAGPLRGCNRRRRRLLGRNAVSDAIPGCHPGGAADGAAGAGGAGVRQRQRMALCSGQRGDPLPAHPAGDRAASGVNAGFLPKTGKNLLTKRRRAFTIKRARELPRGG